MTEKQLKTNYFSNSHLLHLIFQAPGAMGLVRAGPKNLSWLSALDFEGWSTFVWPLPWPCLWTV